jgi:hypothetical protein
MKASYQNGQTLHEDRLDSLDRAIDCCDHIQTIANLLTGYGETSWVEEETVTRAGHMIVAETEKLHDLLRGLGRPNNSGTRAP